MFRVLCVFLAAGFCLQLTGCASWRTQRTPNQTQAQNDDMKVVLKDANGNVKQASAAPTMSNGKEVTPVQPNMDEQSAAAAKMKEAIATTTEHIENTHEQTVREPGPVAWSKALGWLKNGNHRFVKGFFRKDGASAKDRQNLVANQRPHTVIFTTSDSRVPPEVIFDQKLGEVYVVRSLFPSTDVNVVGSIEYAVQNLGTNLVVVLGHDGNTPHLDPNADSWGDIDDLSTDLIERSAILRDGIASGAIRVVQGYYHLESGLVEWSLDAKVEAADFKPATPAAPADTQAPAKAMSKKTDKKSAAPQAPEKPEQDAQ